MEKDITCIEVLGGKVYAAVGQDIYVLNKKLILNKLSGHNKKVIRMMTFGGLLLSFDIENKCIIWDENEEISNFKFDGTLTALLHPMTYLDKIVIGTQEGRLSIWNIRVGKLVYRMDFGTPITCLQNTPCLDVIAVGFSNGDIFVHNIKKDKKISSFKHTPGPVTSISFRHDETDFFASGNGSGEVAIWNLKDKKLVTTFSQVHNRITLVSFLPKEPILLTSGEDNTIRQFIFDRVDKLRTHREIAGNRHTPHFVRFYDPTGNFLLSVDSSIKHTSLVSGVTTKISNGGQSLHKIVDFDYCHLRQNDWDNMITAHNNQEVHLWNVKNRTINTKKSLIKKGGSVKAVKMSICGNFAVVGRSNGSLEKWNVQSGTEKLDFQDMTKFAHTMAITGLSIDTFNTTVSSCSLDGFLKFWNFESGDLVAAINMETSILKMISLNNMIALVSNNSFEIILFDVQTMRAFRKFANPETSKYNDIIFSHDGKFLLACNDESSIFVWDIITGNLVNWIKVQKPAISMAFHPEGLYLATSHLESVGIHLWVNRHLFGKATICKVTKPTHFYEIESNVDGKPEDYDVPEVPLAPHESTKLITTCGLTKTMFHTITHLEDIREKSKLESTKTKIIAPFFLSEAPKIEVTRDEIKEIKQNDFVQRKMLDLIRENNRSVTIAYIKECNPKQIDLGIRTLSAMYNLKEILEFLDFLIQEVESLENFDLIQALISVFLNIHGELIINSESAETFDKIDVLKEKQKIAYEKLNDLIISNASLSKVFSN